MLTPPLADWEDELGRMAAERLRVRVHRAMSAHLWDAADLEQAILDAERRLTRQQRNLVWRALTGDRRLARLARGLADQV